MRGEHPRRVVGLSVVLGWLVAILPVHADEGMWQPSTVPQIAERLRSAGMELEPQTLTDLTGDPLGAVIGLGFCSAGFVSAEGLALTNHHCAYGAIQYLSTPERNRLDEGFVAPARDHELPVPPSIRIYVTTSISDVTESVLQAGGRLQGRERFDAIDGQRKRLVQDCEAKGGVRCRVFEFHGGYRYQLVEQLEIQDVRLVYAPPRSIGRFGGQVDNFSWPRHTGDFTLFRAYVAPDGTPAPYSEDNVPYRPPRFLRMSRAGLSEGDFVMALGYPGGTYRYRLAVEVEEAIHWIYPLRIQMYQSMLDVLDLEAGEDEEKSLLYTRMRAGLDNSLKFYRGMLAGFSRDDPTGRKQEEERRLREWLQGDQTRSGEFLDDLEALEREIALGRAVRDRDLIYDALRRFSALLRAASDLYRFSVEREKPDIEREAGYQERDRSRLEDRLKELDRRSHPTVDQSLMARLMGWYAGLPATQRVAAFDQAFGLVGDEPDLAGSSLRLENLYRATQLGDESVRLAWMDRSPEEFRASDDPMIQLAVALLPSDLEREAERKAREGRLQALRSRYMEALLAFRGSEGRAAYADANNSIRISFGTVRGYEPRDGVIYRPYTRLTGVVEKTTGEWPFNTPERVLEAVADDETLAHAFWVNFLSDVDGSGGSSGSPTLNARGDLVGLAFDGNQDSMIADWSYDDERTRAIHVDIRYMLWVMEEIDGAGHLVREFSFAED